MIKKLLLILTALAASVVAILFVATTFKNPLIPDQYCKKVYEVARQCVPGCIWTLHEPEFSGFVIEKDSQPFIPQGTPTCDGR